MTPLLLVHLVATVAMTGVLWFVQVVHYPLFAAVGREGFPAYEQSHVTRTSFVVMPLMLVEAGTAALLLFHQVPLATAGILFLAIGWGITFLVAVPCHRTLERGFDTASHGRLVHSNGVRTAAWSARATVAVIMVAKTMGSGAV